MQAVNISLTYTAGLSPALLRPSATAQACTYASSGLGIVNSPVVIYKERLLTKEDSEFKPSNSSKKLSTDPFYYISTPKSFSLTAFRAALNGIREEQGRLAEQNDILSAEIDDLESEVRR